MILTTNGIAIEQGYLPERLHSQSLKNERDGIDRLGVIKGSILNQEKG